MQMNELLPVLLVGVPFGAIGIFLTAFVIRVAMLMWKDLGESNAD